MPRLERESVCVLYLTPERSAEMADYADIYPRTFFPNQAERRPLKLGVRNDLVADTARHGLSDAELRRALSQYCRSPGYLAACTEGAVRIDLNGMPAGTVTAEAVAAAVKIARLSQKSRERRETKLAEKAVVPKQQSEKAAPASIAAPNGKRVTLADLRVAAHRRQATGV
jgi:ProP effector